MNLFTRAVLTVFLGSALVGVQAAEDPANAAPEKKFLPWEKGSAKFGAFVTAFDSTLAFGINDAAGVSINAEKFFDLDSSLWVFRAEAMYRPGASLRHQLDFSYAAYHRDGRATATEELNIDGTVIPVGATVKTVFNFDIIHGTYSYALLQDQRMRIALGLGIYAVPLTYKIDIQTVGGDTVVEGADTTLPLPAVALRADFQLIPKLFLYASIDAMYLEISDFKGSLLDVNVGLEYRIWKHFGLGLGYNSMSVEVESNNQKSGYPGVDFVGEVGVRFSGLLMYGKVTF